MFGATATHSWGAGGSLMQNVHVAFACANSTIVELVPSPGDHTTYLYITYTYIYTWYVELVPSYVLCTFSIRSLYVLYTFSIRSLYIHSLSVPGFILQL
jgi:hypothetical protein